MFSRVHLLTGINPLPQIGCKQQIRSSPFNIIEPVYAIAVNSVTCSLEQPIYYRLYRPITPVTLTGLDLYTPRQQHIYNWLLLLYTLRRR